MYILYKTTNTLNGKYYIGVTNGNDKWYKGSGTALLNAMREYGYKNFERKVLESFETAEEAYVREAEVVTENVVQDRQSYNMKVGGWGGIGQKKTEAHKANIAKSIQAKYDNGHYQKAGSSNAGRKPAMCLQLLINEVEIYGVKEAAKRLGLSFYQCRDRYYRAKSKNTVSRPTGRG